MAAAESDENVSSTDSTEHDSDREFFDRHFNETSSSEFDGFESDDLPLINHRQQYSSSESEDEGETSELKHGGTWTQTLKTTTVLRSGVDAGPRLDRGFNIETATPIEYFSLFLQEEIFEHIAEQTNSYAELRQQEKQKSDKTWYPTCKDEIRAYLGLSIIMGVAPRCEYKDYWSSDQFLRCEGFARVITINRYEKLTEYLHLNCAQARTARCDTNYHPLNKVRCLVEMAQRNFKLRYDHSTEISIDEAMKRFKGRSDLRQYMPNKPDKWGIKFWCRCDGVTSYMSSFQLYTGKRDSTPLQRERGLGFRVIHDLSRDLVGLNHHLYFDRYFASVDLVEHLRNEGIFTCATMMSNRKSFPPDLRMKNSQLKKKLQCRGDSITYQKGSTCVTVWNDNNLVTVIYNNVEDPSEHSTCRRQVSLQSQEIPQPKAVSLYNKHMNGVDIHDQLRKKYSAGRSSKKYWKYIMWFVIDCCRVNAWILYKLSSGRQQVTRKRYTQKDFVLELGRSLISGFSSRKRTALSRDDSLVSPFGIQHQRLILPGPKRRCKGCYRHHKRRRESIYGCQTCNIHLCEDCFVVFHKLQSTEA